MPRSPLADAFDHHVWATLTLFDSLADLTPEQLETSVPGTYGSIRDTAQHLVGSDCSYLSVISGGSHPRIDEETMDLPQLRAEMEINGPAWSEALDEEIDPDEMLLRVRDDGSTLLAPKGIRLAQVLHHGTDHRSQICTVLTQLGIEPPLIDVWDFAESQQRLVETPPTAAVES
jgi:uncharacterized damage-inducible protein DinB